MTQPVKKTIGIFSLLLMAALIILIWGRINTTIEIQEQTQVLPAFTFTNLDHTLFHADQIADYDGRLIIVYFDPDCAYCQDIPKKILLEKEKLKDSKIIMVTQSDRDKVIQYAAAQQLLHIAGLHLLLDTKHAFPGIFGTRAVPSFFVYKHNKLVNKFTGSTRFENLLSDTAIKPSYDR